MAVNVVVASGKFPHAFHAAFLPIPTMDTTSLPVKAWKQGRAWQHCSPNISECLCMLFLSRIQSRALGVLDRRRSGLPTLQHQYIPSWGMPSYNHGQQHGASGASSASSCWHGAKADKYMGLMLSTISAFVVNRWYYESTVILYSSRLINWKSSSLLWLSWETTAIEPPWE